MVAEWATETYPTQLKYFNLRVGAGPTRRADSGVSEAEWAGTIGNLRRFVDCLVVLPDELVMVEGKIIARPDAVGQLRLYASLLPHTPELGMFVTMPVRSVLLCAVEDPAVTAMAIELGIETIVYRPPWVTGYLESKAPNARIAPAHDAGINPAAQGTP